MKLRDVWAEMDARSALHRKHPMYQPVLRVTLNDGRSRKVAQIVFPLPVHGYMSDDACAEFSQKMEAALTQIGILAPSDKPTRDEDHGHGEEKSTSGEAAGLEE